jgi:hypothetical protein
MMSAAEREPVKRAFSLVIRGGAGSLDVGDMNTALTSIDGYYWWIRATYPDWVIGKIPAAFDRFKDWEAEIQWAAWKGLSVGVALSGPIHLNSKGFVSYLYSYTLTYSVESEARMAAPVKLNLYYSFPIHSNFNLVLNGGIGLYHARMTQTYNWLRRYLDGTDVIGNYHFDVTGNTAGYHCGVVLEYKLNDRFSMMAESQWTFAKIKSLKGSANYLNNEYDEIGDTISSESSSEDGYLYHYLVDLYSYYREELAVYSDPSTIVDEVSGLRKAFLDLSGFTFKIGLRIRLF